MPKLPPQKPKELIKKLAKVGFFVDHVTGSHKILYKEGHPRPVVVPSHNKDLKKGTLLSILEQAELSKDEFLKL